MGLPSQDTSMVLYYVDLITAILSLIGSLSIAYSYYEAKTRTTILKLIFGIALADFMYSIANIMSLFENTEIDVFCRAEATIRAFSFNSGLTFTTSIAVFCYRAIKEGSELDQSKFLRRTFMLSIIFNLAFCLL